MQAWLLSMAISPYSPAPDNLGPVNSYLATPGIALNNDICSQAFVYEDLANGLAFSSNYNRMMADDFNPWMVGAIQQIFIWAAYPSGNPTGFKVEVRFDAGNIPGEVWRSTTSSNIVYENTGFTQWGYPLILTKIYLQDFYVALYESKGWLALQTMGGSGEHFWLCAVQSWADMSYFSENNGWTWTSTQEQWGTAYEQFVVILGYIMPVGRTTWGAIKATF
jgi:hypothetical protein